MPTLVRIPMDRNSSLRLRRNASGSSELCLLLRFLLLVLVLVIARQLDMGHSHLLDSYSSSPRENS